MTDSDFNEKEWEERLSLRTELRELTDDHVLRSLAAAQAEIVKTLDARQRQGAWVSVRALVGELESRYPPAT